MRVAGNLRAWVDGREELGERPGGSWGNGEGKRNKRFEQHSRNQPQTTSHHTTVYPDNLEMPRFEDKMKLN